jgi:hypothetical protein
VTCLDSTRGFHEHPDHAADPVPLIEIQSPGNQAQTWSNVWAYTSITSVMEILVLHSMRVTAA